MKSYLCPKCGSQEPEHECSPLAMAELRIACLESVLSKIQTHPGFDNNNCAMKSYDVLCECQQWAEEVLNRMVSRALLRSIMTFDEFCNQWNVTGHERRELRLYLAVLRLKETLKL